MLPWRTLRNFRDRQLQTSYSLSMTRNYLRMQEVNLSFGELDRDAGLAVANALANKRALRTIELNGNVFGEEGIDLLRGSLEAKGHLDALGSLSDDEGLEDEDEEETEEGREDNSVLDTSHTEDIRDNSTAEKVRVITMEEYLRDPSGENLVALGEDRIQLLLDHMAAGGKETQEEMVEKTVAMFIRVTHDYYTYLEGDENVRKTIESVIDGILQPLFEDLALEVINKILIHLGILKSEDKKFFPVKEIEGPVQALMHVVESSYCTKMCVDILIAFFTKPCPVLTPLQNKGIVYQLLQTLYRV